MVYENVYIELCKIFKVKQEKIEMNSQMFKNMLALIDGRVRQLFLKIGFILT